MYCKIRFTSLISFFSLCLCFQLRTYGQQRYWPDGPASARVEFVKEIKYPEIHLRKRKLFAKLRQFFSKNPKRAFIRPAGLDAHEGILIIADPGAGGVHLINQNRSSYSFLVPQTDLNVETPVDVAIGNKRIFISYSRCKVIEVFNLRGKFLYTLKPKFEVGRFSGISYHHPYIIIVDTPNHKVMVMNDQGVLINTIGQRGDSTGCFNYPSFVTVSKSGFIYISDTMNFRAQVFSLKGVWHNTVGERGIMSGQLNRPKGIATDRKGNLFVIDASFDNVQIFSPNGEYLLHFGSPGHESGQFAMPTDIAIDGDHIYVSDTMNRRVQIFKVIYE